jgi:hypothetical protein
MARPCLGAGPAIAPFARMTGEEIMFVVAVASVPLSLVMGSMIGFGAESGAVARVRHESTCLKKTA